MTVIWEILAAILAALTKGGVQVLEDSLAGNIKAAPVVQIDAAAAPPALDKQVAADLAAFEAANKK